jgi:hypothetical protein
MLKFFEKDGKLNWVDSNNVFVGLDNEGDCCEVWGGDFYDGLGEDANKLELDLSLDNDWAFDVAFYSDSVDAVKVYDGGSAGFRLIDEKGNEIFLVIWNEHNGYYCHGFDFCNGDVVIVHGSI